MSRPRNLNRLLAADAQKASDLGGELVDTYETWLDRFTREAVKAFARYAGGSLTAAANPGWSMPDPDELLDVVKAQGQLAGATREVRERIAETSVTGTLTAFGIAFNMNDPLIQGVLENMGRHITRVVDEQRAEIMGAVQEGYDQGLSIGKTAKLMRAASDQVTKMRAERIARTEITAATSGASLAAARMIDDASPDVSTRKFWIATDDDRCRDTHIDAGEEYGEGSGIPLTHPFIVGGSELQHPGDPGGPPEEVINCRCSVGYEQAGGGAITASIRDDGTASILGRVKLATVRMDESRLDAMKTAARDQGITLSEAMRVGAEHVLGLTPIEELDVSDTTAPAPAPDAPEEPVAEQAPPNLRTCEIGGSCCGNCAFFNLEGSTCEMFGNAPVLGQQICDVWSGDPADDPDGDRAADEGAAAGEGEAFEQAADEEHTYQAIDAADAPEGACSICGKPQDDPIHGVEKLQTVKRLAARNVQANGFRIMGFALVEPTGETGDSPSEETPVIGEGSPFRATLAFEEKATGDGRIIAAGALDWREPPLTLMAIIEDSHGGMPTTKSMACGRIDTVERQDGGVIVGSGVFDTGEVGTEIARLVTEKVLRGVSVDLAVSEVEELYGEDAEAIDGAIEDPFFGELFILRVLKGTIMGATVCAFPAFEGAEIEALVASMRAMTHLPSYAMPAVRFNADRSAVTAMTLLGEFDVVEGPDVPAAPSGSGGGMVCLYPTPEEAAAIADPDGNVVAEGLHITLFHLAALDDVNALAAAVDDYVSSSGAIALAGQVGGAGILGGDADADGAPQVLIPDVPGLVALRASLATALDSAGITYSTDHDFVPHITVDYDDPNDFAYDSGLVGKPLTFNQVSVVTDDGTRLDVPMSGGLTASAAGMVPVAPPGEWLEYPSDVQGLEALSVGKDGRVRGHVAVFNECHLASPQGRCITAPHHYRKRDDDQAGCAVCGESASMVYHSQAGYEYFHLGEVETAEGDLVRVGQITVGTTHPAADSRISAKMAQEHYDHTGHAVADVRIYEDDIGVFAAGALRPDVPAARVREFRGAKPSGDWRPIRGRSEMVGVLAVNTPGFPIRRGVRIEDGEGQTLALVAAGYPDYDKVGTEPDCREATEVEELVAGARVREMLAKARQRR